MNAEYFRKRRLALALRTAALTGPGWGVCMFLFNAGDVNGPALAASALLFGLIMGGFVYWNVGRHLAEGRTDDLALSYSRSLAVSAPPSQVFERIRAWLDASSDHDVIEASAEFGTLRAKRKGVGLHLGEEVAVHFVEQAGGTAIRVVSHSTSPVQQLDSGCNRRNVDEVATLLVDAFEVDAVEATRTAVELHRQPHLVTER